MLRPEPFKAESSDNASQIYFVYNNEGYMLAVTCMKNKDSIAAELAGRDGLATTILWGSFRHVQG